MKFKEKILKNLHYIILALIIILMLLVVNISFTDLPYGPDEQSYQGAANRMVKFNNKELTIFYPNSALLFSYLLGVISLWTNVDIGIIFRIFHNIILVSIIFSFYYLGAYYKKKTGIILALLVALFYSATFWLGPAYMVPSTLLFIILPIFILALIKNNYLLIAISIFSCAIFYWWGLLPIFLTGYIYFLLTKKKYIFTILSLAIFFIIIKYILSDYLASVLTADLPNWYFNKLSYVSWFYLPVLILSIVFIKYIIGQERTKKLFTAAISLITVNLLFLFSISDYSHMRTIVFLFLGMFIIFSLFFSITKIKITLGRIMPVIFLLIIIPLTSAVALNYKRDIFDTVPFTIEEKNVYNELGTIIPVKESLVISDYSNILISTFYLDDLSYRLLPIIRNDEYINLEWITRFLHRIDFIESDFERLDYLKTTYEAKDIYVIISPRTRYWIEAWASDGKIRSNRVVERDAADLFKKFVGENKFYESEEFKLIIENTAVEVFKY